MEPKGMTSHTCPLTSTQAKALEAFLKKEEGWEPVERDYTIYAAKKEKLNVSIYEKGPKVLIQGKGTSDFITFVLEPQILGEAKLGYEEIHSPELFAPHIGIDESGKGDFFGPLVIAAAYVDRPIARALIDGGVVDSKQIGSDARISALADLIRQTTNERFALVSIGPDRYNELYKKFGNLNRLLAWGHARALESLLEKVPDCPRAISDQFANPQLLKRALMERGKQIELVSRTKAESDVAVAAASILARERFVNWLKEAGKRLGRTLPKGASNAVVEAAQAIVDERGGEALKQVAKVHFRTAHAVAPDVYPPPPERRDFYRNKPESSQ